MNMVSKHTFDNLELRSALGRFITGVTVVTTIDESGKPCGVTANSFTSVSLEPPLVLWNQAISSKSHPAFRDSNRFTINVLAEDQGFLSKHFSHSSSDKFSGVEFIVGSGGVPVLEGCCAVFECRKVATYDGGDHAIFIGEVERIFADPELQPLVFGDGKYKQAIPL